MDIYTSLKARRDHNLVILAQSFPSEDPGIYSIKSRDYKKNNSDEKFYKQKWMLPLLRSFDCKCAVCKSDEDGIELDHFWVPKSKGGNLILKLKDSNKLVNNAAPLCINCNRSKLDEMLNISEMTKLFVHEKTKDITLEMNGFQYENKIELIGYIDGDIALAQKDLPYLKKHLDRYQSDPKEPDLAFIKECIEDYLFIPKVVK